MGACDRDPGPFPGERRDGGSSFDLEGEVLVLQHPITKVISALTLALASLSPLSSSAPSRARAVPREGAGAPASRAEMPSPEGTEAPRTTGPCAPGMILVDGEACPDAEQRCLRWIDPPPYQNLRCAEYAEPARCKGARVPMRFCIDRDEALEPAQPGEIALPAVSTTWTQAKAACAARGARLCREAEWQFACEGPDATPYPYGFRREAGACNVDRTDLGGMNDKLIDHRAPPGHFARCTSPFGVRDMTGNVDEWTEREGSAAPYRSALRGGWWLPGRNRCRAATLAHHEGYAGKQVGYRCCADAP